MLYKRQVYVMLYVVLLVFTSCGKKYLQSEWKGNNITIDGLSKDWDRSVLMLDEDLNMVYGIANDDSAMYFNVSYRDEFLARKMAMRGFTLWLGKEKRLGIRYIDKTAQDMMHARMMHAGNREDSAPFPPENMGGSLPPKGKFYLQDNTQKGSEGREYVIDSTGLMGIQAAMEQQDGFYCFEYRIPLAIKDTTGTLWDARQGKYLETVFELAGLDESVKKQLEKRAGSRPQGMPGGRGGGMGGPGGGMGGRGGSGMDGRGGGLGGRPPGGGAGRDPGERGDMRQDFKAQTLKVSIKLATE